MNLWTALVLGLFGSLHCAGMCGPLALALPPAGKNTAAFFLGRLGYNLGRILTYCFIGLVFGALGKTLVLAGVQRWASITLGILLLAGLVFSRQSSPARPLTGLVQRLKFSMGSLLHRRSFAALLLLGLLNGFLPCGLVYVAAGAAALTGGMLAGAQYMLCFGLGTVPMLLAIACAGKLVPVPLRLRLLKAVPVAVGLLAALLILRGLNLGIPYLSPALASGSCCGPQ